MQLLRWLKLLANQLDIVVVDKEQKTTVMIYIYMAISADSYIRKKEHKKTVKYKGPKLKLLLQQIAGTTSAELVQKSTVRAPAEILCRTSGRALKLQDHIHTTPPSGEEERVHHVTSGCYGC